MNRPAASGDTLVIAEIVGVHGVRGACKVRFYGGPEMLIADGARLDVADRDGRRRFLTVAWVKPHGRGLLMAFEEINDRAQAEALVGAGLHIQRTAMPPLEEGSYYWFELIGMAVYTTDGRFLGKLHDVIQTGSNDVYVVQLGERETLVPALVSVVKTVDTQHHRMEVDLPPGL